MKKIIIVCLFLLVGCQAPQLKTDKTSKNTLKTYHINTYYALYNQLVKEGFVFQKQNNDPVIKNMKIIYANKLNYEIQIKYIGQTVYFYLITSKDNTNQINKYASYYLKNKNEQNKLLSLTKQDYIGNTKIGDYYYAYRKVGNIQSFTIKK